MIRALLVLTIGLCCVNAFAEEPPFAAIVSGENVNMRSGPDLNFEIIGKLNRKKKLVVTGKKEGWYKVQLPADILSYIHKDYLDVEGAVGKVKGDRVNIRCGAGENFTILGQINNGESVAILGKKGEWWEIKPLKEAAGWVHSDFVQFYAKVDDYIAEEGLRLKKEDILSGLEKRYQEETARPAGERAFEPLLAGYQDVIKDCPPGIDVEKIKGRIKEIERFITEAELIRKTTALEEKVARLASPPEENLPPPAAAGIIEDLGGIINRPAAHKLIIDGKMAYYLKSQAVDLNKFIYQKVLIWGQISQPEKNLLPVITVEKIKPAVE